jgi:predicted small secreted protein
LKKTLLILPLVLIAAALALSACGGGSSSSGGGDDETAIAEAIEKSATSSDPSKCTEFQTEEFNEQDQAVSGKKALKACEESAEESESPAESVDVSNIKVDGETATADAAVSGSALNGQSVEIEMADEAGQWKLNKFLGFAKFDAKALSEGLEEQFEGQEGISPALAKCVTEGFAEVSQEEAESMAFEGNTEAIEELAEGCE